MTPPPRDQWNGAGKNRSADTDSATTAADTAPGTARRGDRGPQHIGNRQTAVPFLPETAHHNQPVVHREPESEGGDDVDGEHVHRELPSRRPQNCGGTGYADQAHRQRQYTGQGQAEHQQKHHRDQRNANQLGPHEIPAALLLGITVDGQPPRRLHVERRTGTRAIADDTADRTAHRLVVSPARRASPTQPAGRPTPAGDPLPSTPTGRPPRPVRRRAGPPSGDPRRSPPARPRLTPSVRRGHAKSPRSYGSSVPCSPPPHPSCPGGKSALTATVLVAAAAPGPHFYSWGCATRSRFRSTAHNVIRRAPRAPIQSRVLCQLV